MSVEELRLLRRTVRRIPFQSGALEIGTAAGGSLVAILESLRESGSSTRVVCIDPMRYIPDQLATVRRNLVAHDFAPEAVEFWIGTSEKFYRMKKDSAERFDFILIDGNHKYRHVVMDLRWSDLLAPAGRLALHDYAPQFPGVTRAVDRFLARNDYYHLVDRAGSLVVLARDAGLRHAWRRRETSLRHVAAANVLTPISQVLKKLGLDFLRLT